MSEPVPYPIDLQNRAKLRQANNRYRWNRGKHLELRNTFGQNQRVVVDLEVASPDGQLKYMSVGPDKGIWHKGMPNEPPASRFGPYVNGKVQVTLTDNPEADNHPNAVKLQSNSKFFVHVWCADGSAGQATVSCQVVPYP